MTQAGASSKVKSIGEAVTASNYYPSAINNKHLTKPGLFFLLAKFIFVFATTGKPCDGAEAKVVAAEAIAMNEKHLLLHMDVLRHMQKEENRSNADL